MMALRPYQQAAITAIYDYFDRKAGHPVAVIPTAGGKSLVMASFIQGVLTQWPDQRILIVTHVRELIAQNYAELIGIWPEAPAGIYSAGLGKRDLSARILFAGIQSIHKRAYDVQQCDLVLIDEAHLIPCSSNTMYRRFLDTLAGINPALKVIGFTATPYRLDSGMLHEGEGALFTDIAYEISVRDLIDAGFLCPLISKAASISAVGVEAVKPWSATRRITVAADRDEMADGSKTPSRRGEKAAATLAERLANVLPVSMSLPGEPGQSLDWLDVLRRDGVDPVRSGIEAATLIECRDTTASEESDDDVDHFDHKAEIVRLAKLTPFDYERERITAAKRLRIRPMVLDGFVKGARLRKSGTDEDDLFPVVEPWPTQVDPAELLDAIRDVIHQFIVCSAEVLAAVPLWVVFTWLIDRVQVAPLLVITAPTMKCGKSQLLSVVRRLSSRPLAASNISTAAIYRIIEAWAPTLLIDEADAFLGRNEELRGILDSGHTRELAYVYRLVGDDHEPARFSTWGAKAIAGIGHLPATIADRAIILELRRKLPHENAERLRHADAGIFDELRSKLARFAQDAGEIIGCMRPTLPDKLNDRAQDNWEPLLAIADHAGGHWPDTARATALKLSGVSGETLSLSSELLADVRDVFEQRGGDKIATNDLLATLNADEERPWATYRRGKPLNARDLAQLLREYGIKPDSKWMGHRMVLRGYSRADFEDAFARYLPVGTSEDPAVQSGTEEERGNLEAPGFMGRISLPPPLPVPPPSLPPLAHSGIPKPIAACEEPSAMRKPAETLTPSGIAHESGDVGDDIEL